MSFSAIQEFLDRQLFEIGGAIITPGTVLAALLVLAISIFVARWLERSLARGLRLARVKDEGTVGVAGRVAYYAVLVIGTGIAVDTLGINLTSLFVGGAALAVAVGFAAQNVLQNFFSGLILLSEGAIKPGDVLDVEGQVVRVSTMGIRSTVVRTRDDEELILPNTLLAQSAVKNYTLGDSLYRLRTKVGVHYDSDMRLVKQVLTDTAAGLSFRIQERDPLVLLTEFGDFAVLFDISVWVEDPWQTNRTRSEMNEAIWWALKEAGITIAFPQLDLHLDRPALDAIGRSNRR